MSSGVTSRWRWLLGLLGLVILLSGLWSPDILRAWRDTGSEEGKADPMAEGARHVTVSMVTAGGQATFNLVCFHADKFRMAVASNPLPNKNRWVAGMAGDNKAVAACNGGYFHLKDLTPAGLEIAQGVSTGTLGSSGAFGALFGIKRDVPFIAPEKEFQIASDVSGLVQCGPMLVDKEWAYRDAGQISVARTFVMTDGNGQWAIGNASHLSLAELAEALSRPGLVDGFHVQRAMALDGGPSAGLWWQDAGGHSHEIRERWRVRNVLLVVPR